MTVDTVAPARTALALTGLPVGFELRAGDYVSVITGAGGRELFRLARGGTADATGLTPEMEVVPDVPVTIAGGEAVDLINPMVEMVLEPGSLDDPWKGLSHRAMTFEAVQVIR